jgi:transcriptional regulator with XRE-family HTH domain
MSTNREQKSPTAGQESDMETIGQRLREVRGGMTQAEFASQLGVVSKTISRYESNETVPDGAFLLKLKDMFDISPDWLLLGKQAETGKPNGLTFLKELRSTLDNEISNLEKGSN